MIGSNRDAAEIRAVEERPRSADFVADPRYEVRTALNEIVERTSLLLDGDPTPDQRVHLNMLAAAGRSLLTIIDDVLDLSEGSPLLSRRILVVDDNPFSLVLAKSMLVEDGHDVVGVVNGAEALTAVQTPSFDLVFMDIRMPVMDGVQATRRIRALKGTVGSIPIVGLSASVTAEQIATCREAGMNDHLVKPLDRYLLGAAVARWGSWRPMPLDEAKPSPALAR